MSILVDMGRIVIISDTHLGRPDSPIASPDQLRPLWRDANQLVVNGDLAEISDPRYRANSARLVCQLQDLCDSDGVELTLIAGNHDPFLTDTRFVELSNGLIYVTHGDVLHPAISPWSTHADELAKFNDRALAMLRSPARASDIGKLAASQYAAVASWDERADPTESTDSGEHARPASKLTSLARKAAVTLWCWHTVPRRAAAYMAEHAPNARFFVFGHMHRAGIWEFGERIIMNTGCYGFPSKPRAVVVDDAMIRIVPVQQASNGVWCPGVTPIKEWPLEPLREAA